MVSEVVIVREGRLDVLRERGWKGELGCLLK